MSEILLKLSGSVEMRWIDTYFPFTNPSFELEIYFQVCHCLGIYILGETLQTPFELSLVLKVFLRSSKTLN
jgi:phenylalanyl-tRNA synthetase alpha subunit